MRVRAISLSFCLVVPGLAQPPGFRLETVARGINLACAMAFAPDGRLFVLERTTGNIRMLEGGKLGTWATVPVTGATSNSQGLMGIAVDPDFARNGYVYVSYTSADATPKNVLGRLEDKNGKGVNLTVLGPSMAVSKIHNVGPLIFAGDGKLYVSTGDRQVPQDAQDLKSLHGKVLRLNVPDGSVPADNPFSGSYVFSYGHRNAFGMAVHPESGLVYVTENGDAAMDEIDLILSGRNYGWPIHEGKEKTPDPKTEDPLHTWAPTPDPAGCCFYRSRLYPAEYRGAWFITMWTAGELRYLKLDAAGTKVLKDASFHQYRGKLFAVANGPDGSLYVMYSTVSHRGGDRIDRIVYDKAPQPALAFSAVSNRSVGGGMTIGVTGKNGDFALSWLGTGELPKAVPTPFGDLWVLPAVFLPVAPVIADDRAYIQLSVPNVKSFKGMKLFMQGVTVTGSVLKLTNADALKLH